MSRLTLLAMSVALAFAVSAPAETQAAGNYKLVCTYEVQVEYWYWDTDYSYWSTVFTTDDYSSAAFVYDLLSAAKADGTLNQWVPHTNWKFFAVDVKLVPKCRWVYVGAYKATPYRILR